MSDSRISRSIHSSSKNNKNEVLFSVANDLLKGNFGCILILMEFMLPKDLLSFLLVNKNIYSIFKKFRAFSVLERKVVLLNENSITPDRLLINVLKRISYSECVSNISEFLVNFNEFVFNNDEMKKVLEIVFKDPSFFIAGSAVLFSLIKKKDYIKHFKNSDIDIFLITNEPEKSEYFFRSLLSKISKIIKYDYYVVKYYDIFNIIPKDTSKYRNLQFVLRKITSIEELLVFSDLDCTRFVFNGKEVFSVKEGIKSLKTKKNIVPKWMRKESFYKRSEKYKQRGFSTAFSNIHPVVIKSSEINENLKINNGEFYQKITIDYNTADKIYTNKVNQINVNTFMHEKLKEVDIYKSIDDYLNMDYSNHFEKRISPFVTMRKFFIRSCYICGKFIQYYNLKKTLKTGFCRDCFRFNQKKRNQKRDLSGKIAIVTGYHCALKLLRCNCVVVVTTRFAKNARERYLKEKDYRKWKKNLFIYPLDLKNGNLVIKFISAIRNHFKKVDILINNASITIRRPLQYYESLIQKELNPNTKFSLRDFVRQFGGGSSKKKGRKKTMKNAFALNPLGLNQSQLTRYEDIVKETMKSIRSYLNSEDYETQYNYNLFPKNEKDEFLEPVDNRDKNSWNQKINEISVVELLEVQIVNNISPCILISKLFKKMIPKSGEGPSYIINITSDEGYFDTTRPKNGNHPHTNISKSALNQLTRTTHNHLSKYGILVNSIDVGWATSDKVVRLSIKPPLSVEDSAGRALDLILSKSLVHGKLFRNYKSVEW